MRWRVWLRVLWHTVRGHHVEHSGYEPPMRQFRCQDCGRWLDP